MARSSRSGGGRMLANVCRKSRGIRFTRTSRLIRANGPGMLFANLLQRLINGQEANVASTQSAIRYDLDRDVRTVEQMAARLTPYVYESELYGLMPGDLPKLTVGGLLMRLN